MAADTPETIRGRNIYTYDGCIFTLDKLSSNAKTKFWRCKFKNVCRARIHTSVETDKVIKVINGHQHGSLKAGGKDRPIETETLTQLSPGEGCPESIKSSPPTEGSARKSIQRARKRTQSVSLVAPNVDSLVIPKYYKNYVISPDYEIQYMLADSGIEPERILICGREDHCNWSHHMRAVFLDGAFSEAPPPFSQICVLFAARGKFVFPVLYALLPDTTRQTHDRLFRMLKELWAAFDPDSICVDYEDAIMKAVEEHFPRATIHGSLNHLNRFVEDKLIANDLNKIYDNDPDFALRARMIASLAYVPILHLSKAVDVLYEVIPEILNPILQEFQDEYVNPEGRSKRSPRFRPATWSLYERTLKHQDLTNNFAEAHSRLQLELNIPHQCIWTLIDALRTIQGGLDLMYDEYIRGDPPPTCNKYIENDERIHRIVKDFENRTMLEYLQGIAFNIVLS